MKINYILSIIKKNFKYEKYKKLKFIKYYLLAKAL